MPFAVTGHMPGSSSYLPFSLNAIAPETSSSYVSPTLTFENPFDDPSMEPLPLGPTTSSTSSGLQIPALQPIADMPSSKASFVTDGCPSSSFKEQNKELSLNPNLRGELLSILDPVMDFAGSKRSPDAPFSNDKPCKRQRTSLSQAGHDEESMARFRPYQEKQWREQFQNLIQYKLKHNSCCVPHSYPEDPILARWVKRQRYQYKKMKDNNPTSTMTKRRIQDLESIGFVWHSHASAWQEKLNELKAFKQQSGHCNVPSHYPENVALSTWVKCQRRQYKLYTSGKSSTMTMERHRVLESIGFGFDISRRQPPFL